MNVRSVLTMLSVAAAFVVVVGRPAPAAASATPAPGPISAPVMGWNSWNKFG